MRIKDKLSLDELYFGVVLYPMSYNNQEERTKIKTYNLFDSYGVRLSVATYATMSDKERAERVSNPLSYCFGDTWGRTEWEFIMCPWPYREGDKVEDVGTKVDIYRMYVEPNGELLMDLVNRVSPTSAMKFLSEERKRRRKR